MGKPVLGENCRLEVIIEESYDFKVTFWGPSFLESCLSHFFGEGPGGINYEGHKGGVAKDPRPSSHPSVSTMDSSTPGSLLAVNRGCGVLGTPEHGLEPQPQCSSGSLRGALRSWAMIFSPPFHPQNTVDKLIKKTNLALVIGTHSWREQFLEAVTVSAGKWGGRRKKREREGWRDRGLGRKREKRLEREKGRGEKDRAQ